MSIKIQGEAKAAVNNFLDFMGDYFIKEPLPEDQELKLWSAHSIHAYIVIAMNHSGTQEGEEFEQVGKERLGVLLNHALKDREAYLSCIHLMELLSRDGISIPPELGRFAAKFLQGGKPPSPRGERTEGAVTREGVIYACMHIADMHMNSLYGSSSPAIHSSDIVSMCLNERGCLNVKGMPFTPEGIKGIYQRKEKRDSAYNP